MTASPGGPRAAATRKQDALALLATPAIDVWVATASGDGNAHLVPLSLAWTENRVVIALQADSVTARTWSPPGPRGSPSDRPGTW